MVQLLAGLNYKAALEDEAHEDSATPSSQGYCTVKSICVLPCNGLATCPGCTLPPAHRLLEIGTSFLATHNGRSSIEDE
ncbi:hypothetical protein ILYODFUR_010071 [Ilyodon furcidens]|uniref:Uncharacterized protein n=1 Tax=Ilyodon furcidens TaxID=33524 RepID=A0ABV0V3J1_9TELE